MIRTPRMLAAPLVIALCASAAAAQDRPIRESTDDKFSWEGRIPGGGWLRVRSLNGSVEVAAAEGEVAQVQGEKRWRRGDPKDVRFVVYQNGNDILVCALWDEDDDCDDGGYRSHGRGRRDRHNDVQVDFTVKLPRGVKVDASTVNGGVEVRDATADVEARTVNGQVSASTSTGPINASTVNGEIRARMNAVGRAGDMSFTTVNGSVNVEMPAQFNADVELETLNGSVRTDYPMTLTGRIDPRRLRATIGEGGPRIRMKTVNGSVTLRKI